MESNFPRCLDFVFAREGGYTDDPRDPGAATNHGSTAATLQAWRGHSVTPLDVQQLGKPEAARIYHSRYWDAAWCDAMPGGIDLLVFDAAVNTGAQRSLDFLKVQIGLGVPIRGRHHRIHPVDRHLAAGLEQSVLDRLAGLCVPAVIMGLCGRRTAYYRSLPGFGAFGRGWLARVALAELLAMHLWVSGGTGSA